ncbi:hypothetical protein KA107_00445 [Candidatus Pacearchaeota archaeon]|nr:hypothetical protein [Candidatus Pacearchaeota archaeon]
MAREISIYTPEQEKWLQEHTFPLFRSSQERRACEDRISRAVRKERYVAGEDSYDPGGNFRKSLSDKGLEERRAAREIARQSLQINQTRKYR